MTNPRWSYWSGLFPACAAGILAGLLLTSAAAPAAAEALATDGGGGCSCTISGTGSYNCNSPSMCNAGLYACEVTCKD